MKNNLSILFSKDGFSFYVLNNGDLIHQETTLYNNSALTQQEQTPILNLQQDNALYWKQKYNQINVIVHSTQFNIIPKKIYLEYKEPEFWLEYNTELFENDPIISYPLESIDAILLYSYASEIKASLNHYFDDYDIKHSLVSLLNASKEHTDRRVYVNLFLDTLEVMVMENEKLILYNIFNVKTIEDFSYYIINVYKITETNLAEAPLYYNYYNGFKIDEYIKMLSNFISYLKPFNLQL